jgi:hypothetical protein
MTGSKRPAIDQVSFCRSGAGHAQRADRDPLT